MAPSKLFVEDDDPVEKEYDVYITSPLDASTRLYLLQHPTRDRDQAYNAFNSTTPLELRVKPETGFVELDVPINTNINYNEAKALEWGSALEQTKKDGGFGIASGLALAPGPRAQGRGTKRGLLEADSAATAAPSGKGMQHQTLGGQILSRERGTPVYMIGAFQGDKLHLTPLSGLVQMRPQFHHLDAQTVAERQNRARAAAEGQAGRAASKAATADGTQSAPGTKAVLSTTKVTTNDNEDASASNTKQLLEQAQTESWTKLRYFDEEEQEAYDAYAELLFLPGVEEGAPVAQLASTMSNDEYLDAISAPRNDPHGKVRAAKQARAGRKSREHVEVSDDSHSEAVDDEDEDENVDADDDNENNNDDGANGGDVDMYDADDNTEAADGVAAARELRSRG